MRTGTASRQRTDDGCFVLYPDEAIVEEEAEQLGGERGGVGGHARQHDVAHHRLRRGAAAPVEVRLQHRAVAPAAAAARDHYQQRHDRQEADGAEQWRRRRRQCRHHAAAPSHWTTDS